MLASPLLHLQHFAPILHYLPIMFSMYIIHLYIISVICLLIFPGIISTSKKFNKRGSRNRQEQNDSGDSKSLKAIIKVKKFFKKWQALKYRQYLIKIKSETGSIKLKNKTVVFPQKEKHAVVTLKHVPLRTFLAP